MLWRCRRENPWLIYDRARAQSCSITPRRAGGQEGITEFISANPSLEEVEKEREEQKEAKQNFETRTANNDAKCACWITPTLGC